MNIKQQEITNERMRKDVVALPEEPALSFSSTAGMLILLTIAFHMNHSNPVLCNVKDMRAKYN